MTTKYEFIAESQRFKYYACSDGFILSVLKSDFSERKLRGTLKANTINPVLVIKINKKECSVKHLIAKAFMHNYNGADSNILHKDGDPKNCSVDNLIIVPKSQIAKVTGAMSRSQAVIVISPGGIVSEYGSVRKASKAMYCSYQTILDYMNGKSKHSILDGYTIRKV